MKGERGVPGSDGKKGEPGLSEPAPLIIKDGDVGDHGVPGNKNYFFFKSKA